MRNVLYIAVFVVLIILGVQTLGDYNEEMAVYNYQMALMEGVEDFGIEKPINWSFYFFIGAGILLAAQIAFIVFHDIYKRLPGRWFSFYFPRLPMNLK